MKIEINLRVVCINRYYNGQSTDLTEGRTYTVLEYRKKWLSDKEEYFINTSLKEDAVGKWYSIHHFITKEEDLQLDNLIHELIK